MLDYAIKQKWVNALRSGRHRQIFGTGYDGSNGACVLGVLWREIGEAAYIGVASDLPTSKLITMNDYEQRSFPALADWIETHIPCETPPLEVPFTHDELAPEALLKVIP